MSGKLEYEYDSETKDGEDWTPVWDESKPMAALKGFPKDLTENPEDGLAVALGEGGGKVLGSSVVGC